jgi:hypothetical protein
LRRIRPAVRLRFRRILLLTALTAVLTPILASPAHAAVGTSPPSGLCNPPTSRTGPSVDYWLINNTFLELSLVDAHLDDGHWDEFPPSFIPMGWTACWASEHSVFFIGTEGIAHYSTGAGTVTLYWNDPVVGSNDFRCTVPRGYKCVRLPDAGGFGSVTIPVFEIRFDF